MIAIVGAYAASLFLPLLSHSGTPAQPADPPRVKLPPVPKKHPVVVPGDKPVTPETAKPPEQSPEQKEAAGAVPIAFPHPLITEVLYAVPAGEKADANRDGSRHAAGDEFVELVNPHDRPIRLGGYTITDRNPPKKGQLKFTFPALELPPGAVVVIFNGCEQGWGKGEQGETIVGDTSRPPKTPNPNFHNAFVLTMKVVSSRTSWSNAGDYVLLSDPKGNPVQCVHWGDFSEPVPAATLVEQAPVVSKSSIQRMSIGGTFTAHTDLKAPKPRSSISEADTPEATDIALETGSLFSPGWFSLSQSARKPIDDTPPKK